MKIMYATLGLLLLLLLSCVKSDDPDSVYKGMSAKQIFDSAEKALADKSYGDASKRFEGLDAMYPFSPYSERALRDLVYTYYQQDDYISASATASRYIHLYPRSQHVDYVYYMKGLADFEQTRGAFAKFFPMDISYRDPGTQEEAYHDFETLLRLYPKSAYAGDAHQRMVYLRNLFAKQELNVAEFYMTRKMYVAAASRASGLVKNYQEAPQTERALEIMVESNRALGLKEAAEDALRVLQNTYPNSRALKRLSHTG